MQSFRPFSDEQSRLLVNLRQRYETWIAIERERVAMPYDLRRKTVGAYEYLYHITDRSGNGKSLGSWNAEREAAVHYLPRTQSGAPGKQRDLAHQPG